jgi:hypothetical protein
MRQAEGYTAIGVQQKSHTNHYAPLTLLDGDLACHTREWESWRLLCLVPCCNQNQNLGPLLMRPGSRKGRAMHVTLFVVNRQHLATLSFPMRHVSREAAYPFGSDALDRSSGSPPRELCEDAGV